MARKTLPYNINVQMMEAAMNIGAQQGIGKVTMLRVAQECGVTEPTVYRHFETKENLLLQAFLTVDSEIARRAEKIACSPRLVRRSAYNAWNDACDWLVAHSMQANFCSQYRHSSCFDLSLSASDAAIGKTFRYLASGSPEYARFTGVSDSLISAIGVEALLNIAIRVAEGVVEDTALMREFVLQSLFGSFFDAVEAAAPPEAAGTHIA